MFLKKSAIQWILFISLNGFIPILSIAQDDAKSYLKQGRALLGQRKFAEAELFFDKADKFGEGEGTYFLGLLHYYGWGMPRNYSQAIQSFSKASQRGYKMADYRLGQCYNAGFGVEVDKAKASQLFQESASVLKQLANEGDTEAMVNFGRMLHRGQGCPKNIQEAVIWMNKAAEAGHFLAQNSLGEMYRNGDGIEKNYNTAVYWYTQAANVAYPIALYNLGECYEEGLGVAADSPTAVKYYLAAAEQGYEVAQNALGVAYEIGEGVSVDYKKAFEWYKKAAQNDYETAQFNLGNMFRYGRGTPKDLKQMLFWFTKAAEAGYEDAQIQIGHLYANGEGVPRDYDEAEQWFKKAINQKSLRAKIDLAWLYTIRNYYTQAESLYNEILQSQNLENSYKINAFFGLGTVLRKVKKPEEAETMFKSAIDIGKADPQANPLGYAGALLGLADLQFEQKKWDEAEINYKQTTDFVKQNIGFQHPYYIAALQNLAKSYQNQGKDKAYKELESQLNNINKGVDKYYFISQPSYEKAMEEYNQWLELVKNTDGTQHPKYAMMLYNLGQIKQSFSDEKENVESLNERKKLYEEALIILENNDPTQNPTYKDVLVGLAQVQKAQKNTDEAVTNLEKAFRYVEEQMPKAHSFIIQVTHDLASTYTQMQKAKEAETYFKENLNQSIDQWRTDFASMNTQEREVFFNLTKHNIYSFNNFVRLYYAQIPALAADMYNLQIIAKSLLPEYPKRIEKSILNSADNALVKDYTLWQEKSRELSNLYNTQTQAQITAQKIPVEKLQTDIATLEQQIIRKSELFANANFQTLYTWQDIQKALKPDEAAIELVRFPFFDFDKDLFDTQKTHYAALIIRPQMTQPLAVFIDNGLLLETNALRDYYHGIRQELNDEFSFEAFWKPIWDAIPDNQQLKKVFLADDGVYHLVEVGSLWNPKSKSFFAEQLEVVHFLSTKDILTYDYLRGDSLQIATKSELDDSLQVLLLQPVHQDSPPGWVEKELINAQKTIDSLSRVNPKFKIDSLLIINKTSRRFMGQYAPMSANLFFEKSEKSAFFDLAVLDWFYTSSRPNLQTYTLDFEGKQRDNPFREGGILIANTNAQSVDTLRAQTILELDLSNNQLVVLMNYAEDWEEKTEQNILSILPKAFRFAGAQHILLNLWHIDRPYIQEFMGLFYYYLQKTSQVAEAYKAAKHIYKLKYPQPYFWGGFVLLED